MPSSAALFTFSVFRTLQLSQFVSHNFFIEASNFPTFVSTKRIIWPWIITLKHRLLKQDLFSSCVIVRMSSPLTPCSVHFMSGAEHETNWCFHRFNMYFSKENMRLWWFTVEIRFKNNLTVLKNFYFSSSRGITVFPLRKSRQTCQVAQQQCLCWLLWKFWLIKVAL